MDCLLVFSIWEGAGHGDPAVRGTGAQKKGRPRSLPPLKVDDVVNGPSFFYVAISPTTELTFCHRHHHYLRICITVLIEECHLIRLSEF